MKSLKLISAICISTIWTSVFAQPGPQSFNNKADSLMNGGSVFDAIAEYLAKMNITYQPKNKQE